MTRRITQGIGIALIGVAVLTGVGWFSFRIYVPEGMCAVLIKKTG